MKTLKVAWEVPYEGDKKSLAGSFGVEEDKIMDLLGEFEQDWKKNSKTLASDLVVEYLENGKLTGPIAFTMITVALVHMKR